MPVFIDFKIIISEGVSLLNLLQSPPALWDLLTVLFSFTYFNVLNINTG